MGLLYFFFWYAYKYEKQHCAHFAFNLLQLSLSEIFNMSEEEKRLNPQVIGIGHGVLYFVDNGFFESDELDKILLPFDTLAILEIERITRGEFSANNAYGLLLVADYLLSRSRHMDDGVAYSFDIIQHLLTALSELIHHIDNWDYADFTWPLSLNYFFEKSTEKKEVAHLAEKGLVMLKNGIFRDMNQNLKLFTSANLNDNLERSILLSLCFSKTTKSKGNNQIHLEQAIRTKLFLSIEQLYKEGTNIPALHMQRVTAYALTLINGREFKASEFLIHSIVKLIKNND